VQKMVEVKFFKKGCNTGGLSRHSELIFFDLLE
jgi:hypothetical protein